MCDVRCDTGYSILDPRCHPVGIYAVAGKILIWDARCEMVELYSPLGRLIL